LIATPPCFPLDYASVSRFEPLDDHEIFILNRLDAKLAELEEFIPRLHN
jgi:hypothetical protein